MEFTTTLLVIGSALFITGVLGAANVLNITLKIPKKNQRKIQFFFGIIGFLMIVISALLFYFPEDKVKQARLEEDNICKAKLDSSKAKFDTLRSLYLTANEDCINRFTPKISILSTNKDPERLTIFYQTIKRLSIMTVSDYITYHSLNDKPDTPNIFIAHYHAYGDSTIGENKIIKIMDSLHKIDTTMSFLIFSRSFYPDQIRIFLNKCKGFENNISEMKYDSINQPGIRDSAMIKILGLVEKQIQLKEKRRQFLLRNVSLAKP